MGIFKGIYFPWGLYILLLMNFGTLRCLLRVPHNEMLDIFALVFGPCFTSRSLCGVFKNKWESKSSRSAQVSRTPFLKHSGLLHPRILPDWDLTLFFYPLPSWAESRRKQGREDAYIWTTLRGQKEHQLVITEELKRNFDEFGVLPSLKSMNFK